MNSLIQALNLLGERCVGFAWSMLWQSSLLIALLWVLDFTLRRRVRATLIYALWILLLVKLILPPSLAAPTGVAYWLIAPRDAAPALDSPVTITPLLTQLPNSLYDIPATTFQAQPQSFHRSGYLFLIWVGGSTMLFGLVLRRSQRVRRIMNSSTKAPADLRKLLKDCAEAIGLHKSVQLRISAHVVSPAVCGSWRTVVMLPSRLSECLTADQLRAVLYHELVHVKRADLWVNCAQTLLQAVYWWHPLLWTVNARIRRIREHAVDERVMAEMCDGDETYPETLLEVARICVAQPAPNLGWLGITESRSRLRERIKRLLEAPVPKFAKLGWRGLVVVTLAGALVLPMACRRKERSKTGTPPTQVANPVHVQPTSALIAALKTGLADGNEEVRRRALMKFTFAPETVTEAENPALSEAVPILISAAKEDDIHIRSTAVAALHRIRSARPEAIQAVSGLMRHDGNLNNATIAATILKEIGPAAAPAVPTLIETLEQRRDDGTFVSPGDGQIKPQISLGTALRRAVIEALGNIGPAAQEAIPTLTEHLKDKGQFSLGNRVFSAKALWQITGQTDAALPVLIDALKNDGSFWAADILASMGPAAKPAVPALCDALDGHLSYIRLRAALALNKIDPQIPVPTPLLIELLNDQNRSTRVESAAILWSVNHDAALIVPAMCELLTAPSLQRMGGSDPEMEDALRLLAQIGPQAEAAIPSLQALEKTPSISDRLRRLCAEALKSIQAKEDAARGVLSTEPAFSPSQIERSSSAASIAGTAKPLRVIVAQDRKTRRNLLPRNLVNSVAFPPPLLSSSLFSVPYFGQSIESMENHPIRDSRDATVRAIQIANRLAHEDYSVTPFKEDKVRAVFDGQRWSWRRTVPFGRNDLEAEVKIAPDGKVEEANVRLLTTEGAQRFERQRQYSR